MKVYVINIKERSDKLTQFVQNYPADTLGPFEIYFAKTGEDVTPPKWWGTTANRWALIQNFADILSKDDDEDVLICEDDCVFGPDFVQYYTDFIENVPNDWDILYIGGGHNALITAPPRQVNDYALKCGYSLYTHCIAIRGTFKSTLRSWLLETATPWTCYHAEDNRIADLVKVGSAKAYAPMLFLAGQRGGVTSDIGIGSRPVDSFFNRFTYIDLEGKRVKTWA